MKFIEFNYDYSKKKDFKFALFSDLHADAKHCETEKLKRNLDYCYEHYDGILLNGDTFSCLLPSDRKRFTLSHAFGDRDDIIDHIIDYVSDFLSPYAKKINLVAMGNHETAALKYYHTNPAARLVRQLKDHGSKAIFGDYRNIVRFKFNYGDNSRVRTADLWTNHGIGAGAKRSRGVLEWDIIYSKYATDVYWQGHNHMSGTDPSGSYTYADRNGNIKTTRKTGIRTPGWEQVEAIRDIKDDYDLKFGEERCGVPVALPQYGLLEFNLSGDDISYDVRLVNA